MKGSGLRAIFLYRGLEAVKVLPVMLEWHLMVRALILLLTPRSAAALPGRE